MMGDELNVVYEYPLYQQVIRCTLPCNSRNNRYVGYVRPLPK